MSGVFFPNEQFIKNTYVYEASLIHARSFENDIDVAIIKNITTEVLARANDVEISSFQLFSRSIEKR